ncbi:MAG: NAD(P)H-hydrate epimerase, partial [bacterium]|nr:NAD(P)H-hydrate epimerase [bacterium]
MRPVATTEEMKLIDRVTIEGDGLPGTALMENAGRGVVREILSRFPDLGPGDVVVVVGKGNNGGDGLVIARHLAGAGVEPLVFSVGDPGELTGDALANWNVFRAGGRGAWVIEGEEDVAELARALERAAVAVDALLGTGVSGEPRGLFAPVIRALNDGPAFVVAVDVPSGLDSTTGAAGLAVSADLTVTLACPKTGLFLPPGYLLVGEVVTAPIGINPERFA